MTNQLNDDATESMNEGRGLCRVLAVGVLLVVAAAVPRLTRCSPRLSQKTVTNQLRGES